MTKRDGENDSLGGNCCDGYGGYDDWYGGYGCAYGCGYADGYAGGYGCGYADGYGCGYGGYCWEYGGYCGYGEYGGYDCCEGTNTGLGLTISFGAVETVVDALAAATAASALFSDTLYAIVPIIIRPIVPNVVTDAITVSV